MKALVRADNDAKVKITHLDYDHQLTTAPGFKDHGFTIDGTRYYGDGVIINFPGRLRHVDIDLTGRLEFVIYRNVGRERAGAAFDQAAAQQAAERRRSAQQSGQFDDMYSGSANEAKTQAEQYVKFMKNMGVGGLGWP